MKLSEELLTRYATGECTAEEKAFVEGWLRSNETPDSAPYKAEFGEARQRLWERLERETVSVRRSQRRTSFLFMRCAAAACLLLCAAGIGKRHIASLFTVEKRFENRELFASKMIRTDGLAVDLMPGSRAEWIRSPFNACNFKVCGNTVLQAFGDDEEDFYISSSCTGKSGRSRLVRLRRQESYFILTGGVAGGQLVVFESGDINTLHPAHRARVNAVFQFEGNQRI